MSQKTWLFSIFALLCVSAAVLIYNQKSTTLGGENADFAIEDTAAITKIFLADKNDKTILLERTENGWTVNGFEARPDVVSNLLYTIKNMTVRAPVPKVAFQNVIKKIATNSVKVEVFTNEETPAKVFHVGHSNAKKTGTYMLIDKTTSPFLVHLEGHYGFLESRFSTNVFKWRSNSLFAYTKENLKEITVIQPEDSSNSFRIELNEQHIPVLYSLQGSVPIQNVDTTALLNYTLAYRNVNFEGFDETRSLEELQQIIADEPVQEVYIVTDKDGNRQMIETFKKPIEGGTDLDDNEIEFDLDRMYGRIDNGPIVIIQYYTFDPLNRTISDFVMVN